MELPCSRHNAWKLCPVRKILHTHLACSGPRPCSTQHCALMRTCCSAFWASGRCLLFLLLCAMAGLALRFWCPALSDVPPARFCRFARRCGGCAAAVAVHQQRRGDWRNEQHAAAHVRRPADTHRQHGDRGHAAGRCGLAAGMCCDCSSHRRPLQQPRVSSRELLRKQ